MSKAKRIILFMFTLILLGAAGGMFYVQNYYMPQVIAQQKSVVYVANREIGPMARIVLEDFSRVSIPRGAVSPNYVQRIDRVEGFQFKSTIYKGEILSYSRITADKIDADKNLLTTIVPKYYDDILKDDIINLYVIKAEKDSNLFAIEAVFMAKRVEKVNTPEIKTNAGKRFSFSLAMNEEELKRYYAAQHAGDILAVKIINPNLIDIASGLATFNPSEIVFKQNELVEDADPDPEIDELVEIE